MFETDRIPSGWTERLNAVHELWVPTDFQKNVFVKGGVYPDKIHVLGEPVDVELYNPAKVEAMDLRSVSKGTIHVFVNFQVGRKERMEVSP